MNPTNYLKFSITEDKEKKLFKEAIVFFDTSALLDFYYFSEQTREEIFVKLFTPLKERLWISSQTEYEFLKNREKVILKPIDSYNALLKSQKGDGGHLEMIEKAITNIQSEIKSNILGHFKTLKEKTSKGDKHPYLEGIDYKILESEIVNLENSLKEFDSKYSDFKSLVETKVHDKIEKFSNISNDEILVAFQKHFKTSNPFTYTEIINIIEEGELRYRNSIPPGYLDGKEKIGFQKYGDLIIWKQIMQTVKSKNLDLIFVCNDLKEDWWYFDDNKSPVSARHELIREFEMITNHTFWMYDMKTFLYKSNLYIDSSIEEEVISEVKDVSDAKYFIDEFNLIDWFFSYFIVYQIHAKNMLDEQNEVDYIFKTPNGNVAVIKKQISSHLYTRLLFPIQKIIENKDVLLENGEYISIILIIEYPNYDIANNYLKHLEKKTLRRIIKHAKEQFIRVIIGFSKNDSFEVVFDNHLD